MRIFLYHNEVEKELSTGNIPGKQSYLFSEGKKISPPEGEEEEYYEKENWIACGFPCISFRAGSLWRTEGGN